MSKSTFTVTVASVEWFFPRFRGHLTWSHDVIKGWTIETPTKHTVPMGKAAARLVGTHMAARGKPRMGLGITLQAILGLRPSELLGLVHEDIDFDSISLVAGHECAVFRLGTGTGTKLKREQFCILRRHEYPKEFDILRELVAATPPGARVFPFSMSAYRAEIHVVERDILGLTVGWGAHSPRAGYATDGVAEGKPRQALQDGGRWQCDTSFRTYVDVIQGAAIAVSFQERGLVEALRFVGSNLEKYYPKTIWGQALTSSDARPRLEERPGDRRLGAAAVGAAGRSAEARPQAPAACRQPTGLGVGPCEPPPRSTRATTSKRRSARARALSREASEGQWAQSATWCTRRATPRHGKQGLRTASALGRGG